MGGELPDLYASDLKLMRKDQGKLFEDSSRNLSTHDDLLMQALGLPSVTTPIPGEDRSQGDRETPWLQDDPFGGHRLAEANL